MKRTIFLTAFFTLLLSVAAISAQENTANFSGYWELDAAKSKLDERMRATSMTMNVAQTDTELKIQNTTKRTQFLDGDRAVTSPNRGGGMGRGGFVDGTVIYNLGGDGTKSEANAETGASTVFRAEIESGGRLKLTVVRNLNIESLGEASTTTMQETWELADGGKTLKIFREFQTPRGTNSTELFFTKKDPANVSNNQTAVNTTQQAPNTVSGGVLNSKATDLVKPTYPEAARAVKASGAVNVQVTIDEQGNIISASAVSGHPLLRAASEDAARASKFAPTTLSGVPVKVTGVIVYNFVP